MKNEYQFELKMKVRDYECDIQGIVNNANYQHYLEHTRHEFLESFGTSFSELHKKGIDAVVSRVDIQYKMPLTSGDFFISKLRISKEGAKLIFHQDIYREKDNKLAIKGKVEAVVLRNGVLTRGEPFDEVFGSYL